MAFSCAKKPVPTDNAIVVRHSPLSEAACTPTDAAMVRISTERLIVQRLDQDGVWTTIATADGPFEGPNTLRLEGIKSGPLKMRVIGCQGGQVSRVGYYNGQLSEYAKQRIAVELRPTETFSCGGETLRLATDDSTGLSMPSLFSASVPLDDNLLLIAGGAHRDIPSESVLCPILAPRAGRFLTAQTDTYSPVDDDTRITAVDPWLPQELARPQSRYTLTHDGAHWSSVVPRRSDAQSIDRIQSSDRSRLAT